MGTSLNVAILGASNKPDRYSYQALQLLLAKGHRPYPVLPALTAIEGRRVYASLRAIPDPLDTVSLYISAHNQQAIAEDILHCGCRRVIFNPGTENPALATQLKARAVEVMEACTLLLLKTGQF